MKRSVESLIAIRRHGLGRAQVDGGTSVPAFTSRDIRCTTRSTLAASLFIEQGFTPKKVQAMLGHNSPRVRFDGVNSSAKVPSLKG